MVPEVGEILIANLIRARGVLVNARLAKVDIPLIGSTAVLGDFTECDFDGYAAIPLDDFPTPTINVDDAAEMVSPLKTWTAGMAISGPQTIYFVYVTCGDPMAADADELLFFERLTPSVTLANPGEVFQRFVRWRDVNYAP